ncbi:hypothetical protein RSAG8_08906, partial [Rhizoctonia solani AG-8 WAC10335]
MPNPNPNPKNSNHLATLVPCEELGAKNYAYEEDVGACVLGDQSIAQTSAHQTT